jgi:NAD(P)-dependent dehydrogenase (short-subunit alcohol dehydrogenase family)
MTAGAAKNALVTGAARRVGRAIALDLARRGWAVAVHYRTSEAEAHEVVAAIRDGGGKAVAIRADLAETDEVEGLIPLAARSLGTLHCLVNSASVFERDSLGDVTCRSWGLHMEVNVRAPLLLAQGFCKQLREGEEGNVINIIDERVWNPSPHFVSYTISKSALWTLTRVLAPALAPRIRINGIGPGETLPSFHQTEQSFERMCATMPLGRGTTPEEICAAVRFILEARAMTGQMIVLDGGQHLGWLLPGQDEAMAAN